MMNELKEADHELTNEQQVKAFIRSLPHSLEHMKVHLTHNIEIKPLTMLFVTLKLKKIGWSLQDLNQKPM